MTLISFKGELTFNSNIYRSSVHSVITLSPLLVLAHSSVWCLNSAVLDQFLTTSKPTFAPWFAPSIPCIIHFGCLESGPNDSTRVRRLTGILRRARVKIFVLSYGSFWLQLSGFSSNLIGHHETKTEKPIWSCRSKYSTFYFKPRPPMTNEDVLNRFRTFRAVKLQPVWSYRCECRHFRPDEHGKKRLSNG